MAFDDMNVEQDQSNGVRRLPRTLVQPFEQGETQSVEDEDGAQTSLTPLAMRIARMMSSPGPEPQSALQLKQLGVQQQQGAWGRPQAVMKPNIGQRIMGLSQHINAMPMPLPPVPRTSTGYDNAQKRNAFNGFIAAGADRAVNLRSAGQKERSFSVGDDGLGGWFKPIARFDGAMSQQPDFPGMSRRGWLNSDRNQSSLVNPDSIAASGGKGGSAQNRSQKEQSSAPPQTTPKQQAGSPIERQQPLLLQSGPPGGHLNLFASNSQQPEPSWIEIREYIAQEARAYGIPVKLAEAVARHETNFDIHSNVSVKNKKGKEVSRDYGIMAVNSTNTQSLAGPEGFGFKVDIKRVQTDWKYNVHVGMAILRNAYVPAVLNTAGGENIARETYALQQSWKLAPALYGT